MKIANIILKKDFAYLCSESITVSGLWVFSEPFLKLKWNELSVQEKYNHLMATLNASKKNIPMPAEKDLGKKVLKAFGFSSWRKLYKETGTCSIRFDEVEYTFVPMEYNPEHHTHEGIKEAIEKVLVKANVEEIITVFENALSKSR